ncbi:hypothetical protein MRCP2_p3790 (plasmid) [Aquipseudomonas alcaligenes]|nr:hypothetical protein MRCP2_p3790 [Pseudomonas alcaligenes]
MTQAGSTGKHFLAVESACNYTRHDLSADWAGSGAELTAGRHPAQEIMATFPKEICHALNQQYLELRW